MDKVDVLIVGAGHNGLTCAAYLAAAGLRVRVAEMRPAVGGAAVTEEFVPGFRNSTASYIVSLLNPKVIRDLRLAERGLRIVERPFSNFVPLPDGRHLKFGGDPAATQAEVARFVVITLDTTRADVIGAYGATDVETPSLDRLGNEGVVFEQAMTTAPLTLPAHSSIFTARFPPEHGARDNGGFFLAPEQVTLAEVLKADGFKTQHTPPLSMVLPSPQTPMILVLT